MAFDLDPELLDREWVSAALDDTSNVELTVAPAGIEIANTLAKEDAHRGALPAPRARDLVEGAHQPRQRHQLPAQGVIAGLVKQSLRQLAARIDEGTLSCGHRHVPVRRAVALGQRER